jgi:hypothetical protein
LGNQYADPIKRPRVEDSRAEVPKIIYLDVDFVAAITDAAARKAPGVGDIDGYLPHEVRRFTPIRKTPMGSGSWNESNEKAPTQSRRPLLDAATNFLSSAFLPVVPSGWLGK